MNSPCNEFTIVTLKDFKVIDDYLKLSEYEESNHNLLNLMMWRRVFPLWKYQCEHFLLILGRYKKEFYMYMPLCEKKYLEEAYKAGKQIFMDNRIPFVLSCFNEEMKDFVKSIDSCLKEEKIEGNFDYIYPCEQLKTLSGKKLQKKRNHLNFFINNYQGRYEYRSITKKEILDCKTFLESWSSDHQDPMMEFEKEGIIEILNFMDIFGCKGGAVYIDGKIEGFSIGSRLSTKMCQINIEKANPEIRGLYQYLMQQVLINEFNEYELVNREDDMNQENLRQAKMAYAPSAFIEKYRLYCGGNYD